MNVPRTDVALRCGKHGGASSPPVVPVTITLARAFRGFLVAPSCPPSAFGSGFHLVRLLKVAEAALPRALGSRDGRGRGRHAEATEGRLGQPPLSLGASVPASERWQGGVWCGGSV